METRKDHNANDGHDMKICLEKWREYQESDDPMDCLNMKDWCKYVQMKEEFGIGYMSFYNYATRIFVLHSETDASDNAMDTVEHKLAEDPNEIGFIRDGGAPTSSSRRNFIRALSMGGMGLNRINAVAKKGKAHPELTEFELNHLLCCSIEFDQRLKDYGYINESNIRRELTKLMARLSKKATKKEKERIKEENRPVSPPPVYQHDMGMWAGSEHARGFGPPTSKDAQRWRERNNLEPNINCFSFGTHPVDGQKTILLSSGIGTKQILKYAAYY
jgi:hypothetical protein